MGLGTLMERHFVAVEIRQSTGVKEMEIIVFYSSGALHSPPLALNMMTNVLLRAIAPPDHQPHSIHVVNHPFPRAMVQTELKAYSSSCLQCFYLCYLCMFISYN